MIRDPVAVAVMAEPTMGARPSMVSFVSMLMPGILSLGGTGLPRQAERALTDEVALDLVRPGPDRRRLVVEPRALPVPVARVVGRTPPQRRGRAEHRHRGVVEPLAHLAPPQLVDAPDRPRRLALGRPGDRAPVAEP